MACGRKQSGKGGKKRKCKKLTGGGFGALVNRLVRKAQTGRGRIIERARGIEGQKGRGFIGDFIHTYKNLKPGIGAAIERYKSIRQRGGIVTRKKRKVIKRKKKKKCSCKKKSL